MISFIIPALMSKKCKPTINEIEKAIDAKLKIVKLYLLMIVVLIKH